VGIIGGTGFYAAPSKETMDVDTEYGNVSVTHRRARDCEIFSIDRHGRDHNVPPHRVNARAHIRALASAKVDFVIAVFNVGGVAPDLRPGSWVIPHDLVDLTSGRQRTFFDERAVHVDANEPFCPHVRASLLASGGPGVVDRGVYVSVEGPQLETAAGVAALRSMGGDVAGMTAAPEAWLAREAGLCYGAVAFIANAAGAGRAKPGTALRIRDGLAVRAPMLRDWILRAIHRLPNRKTCACRARSLGADLALPGTGKP
jgi:5'-methylthioadenosine phosphorylase